jgi:di/tricarboxylate transporter
MHNPYQRRARTHCCYRRVHRDRHAWCDWDAGLVLQPIPVGAWAFVMLTFTVATKTLPFLTAFAAFRNEVIWLIVVSFFFAKGFEKCGLGERIANLFVKVMGKSTLGLAYGLTLAEGLIAPAMPSTSARAGVQPPCCPTTNSQAGWQSILSTSRAM